MSRNSIHTYKILYSLSLTWIVYPDCIKLITAAYPTLNITDLQHAIGAYLKVILNTWVIDFCRQYAIESAGWSDRDLSWFVICRDREAAKVLNAAVARVKLNVLCGIMDRTLHSLGPSGNLLVGVSQLALGSYLTDVTNFPSEFTVPQLIADRTTAQDKIDTLLQPNANTFNFILEATPLV